MGYTVFSRITNLVLAVVGLQANSRSANVSCSLVDLLRSVALKDDLHGILHIHDDQYSLKYENISFYQLTLFIYY